MELKVACECGQKYKFDVEPVDGRMPFTVNCPICGVDGTPAANQLLTQQFASAPPAPAPTAMAMAAPVSSAASGLRINRPTPAAAPPPLPVGSATPPPLPRTGPAPIRPVMKTPVGAPNNFSMGLGVLGAFLGAAAGGGLMFAFFEWADFRFPWTGTITGALAGLGARTLARGTDSTLGFIAGGIALACIIGVFFLMYGGLPVSALISAAVCVYFAYRIASG